MSVRPNTSILHQETWKGREVIEIPGINLEIPGQKDPGSFFLSGALLHPQVAIVKETAESSEGQMPVGTICKRHKSVGRPPEKEQERVMVSGANTWAYSWSVLLNSYVILSKLLNHSVP